MRHLTNSKYALISLLLFMLVAACATVPITGRSSLNLIPSSSLLSMSFQQYDQFLQSHKVVNGTDEAIMVNRVGSRIQNAVEQYFANHNMADQLNGYEWEFNLVKDSLVNAWCMPGGKVVIYTGILPVTQNETGLAVVMGHEIAHAIANHGNERMSQSLLAQFGSVALDQLIKDKPEETQSLFRLAYGIGANVGVLLPYSRLHESEADQMGLIFMAMAGYDPRTAVSFWERMAKMSSGGAPPEFLSTHPAHETRIQNIKDHMPKAMEYYQAN